MKIASSALFALAVLAPAVALAQPGAAPPPPPPPGGGYYGGGQPGIPGGFHNRAGRLMLGVGLGLGGMNSDSGPVECVNCDYNPIAVAGHFHIGGMMSPRFGLMLELQGNAQIVEDHGYDGNQSLVQSAAMVAAQYWVTPQLWLKGGIGFAHLSYTYSDAYADYEEPIDDGMAALGAIGFELMSARNFSIDLQGRVLVGSYDKLDDSISSGTVGVGFNWF